MQIENSQRQLELVRSLASTIQKKIVTPAADKVDILNQDMKETNRKIAGLEKEISLLAAAHSRTRLMATAAILGLAVLVGILIIPIL